LIHLAISNPGDGSPIVNVSGAFGKSRGSGADVSLAATLGVSLAAGSVTGTSSSILEEASGSTLKAGSGIDFSLQPIVSSSDIGSRKANRLSLAKLGRIELV